MPEKSPIHQSLVVHFLAADGLDGEDVGAGFSAQFKRALEPLPWFAGTHHRRLLLVADVGGRDAQSARQLMLLVAAMRWRFRTAVISAPHSG